jgi:hypothetical protein
MPLTIEQLILSVIIGTLAAIVYSLRVLVLMERRVANIELHIEKLATRVLREELKIEKALKKRKK